MSGQEVFGVEQTRLRTIFNARWYLDTYADIAAAGVDPFVHFLEFGLIEGRLVVVGYTPRGADRHVFSMRKANDREQARIGPILGL